MALAQTAEGRGGAVDVLPVSSQSSGKWRCWILIFLLTRALLSELELARDEAAAAAFLLVWTTIDIGSEQALALRQRRKGRRQECRPLECLKLLIVAFNKHFFLKTRRVLDRDFGHRGSGSIALLRCGARLADCLRFDHFD